MKSLLPLNPHAYQQHAIHGDDRIWAETNCYVDVLIELIHAFGYNPVAGLAFTLSIDFESDQWTFFKYPPIDLLELYGMDVQELNPWRSLAVHVQTQVEAGRPVLVELDSYYLPDTAGTAYKTDHVKSTVAVNEIDIEKKHMGYFHGQGYYHVGGEDFEQLFQLNGLVHERMLPPYIELIKLREQPNSINSQILLRRSIISLQRQLRIMPEQNPFDKFSEQFIVDVNWLRQESIDSFHQYAFATLRQFGACFELAATYLQWLSDSGETDLEEAMAGYLAISNDVKTYQFKLARSIARNKIIGLDELHSMAKHWQQCRDILTAKYLK